MLRARYKYDGKPLLQLNNLQTKMKSQVDRKVDDGTYQFEEVPCCVCDSKEFRTLAEKDRYGLYMVVAICKQCGLIQTNPRMRQEAYNEFYNTEYRKLYDGTETATQKFFESQYRKGHRIFNFLMSNKVLSKSPDKIKVLEIGCGAGGILQYFKEMGCHVKGLDLGEEYIEFGISRYGLELSVATIKSIDTDEPVDIIIYSHVLEHILAPNDELQQIHRTLSDAGVIYIEVPGVKNLMHSYRMDFLRFLQSAHIYHFTLTSLINLMRKNGFAMAVGTEEIRSVFMKRSTMTPFVEISDEFGEAFKHLNKVERFRKLFPISPFGLKLLAIKTLKFVNFYNVARDLYHRIRLFIHRQN